MNFDDHEIWGAPVRPAESAPETTTAETTGTPAVPANGRLYRSAGSDPHPEAILALPHHRRHTSVQPAEASQWATPPAAAAPNAPAAPITINSRIPRPGVIEDAALAEIVATPSAPTESTGFTSWFKSSNPLGAIAAMRNTNTGVAEPQPAKSSGLSLSSLPALGAHELTALTYFAAVFAITTIVGVVNAAVSSSLGIPTGVALLATVALGTWRLAASARWAAWVLPAYALVAAVLVAGQFTESAPGASPVGQVLLVTSALITLAPWLAVATLLGAALPALRGRAR